MQPLKGYRMFYLVVWYALLCSYWLRIAAHVNVRQEQQYHNREPWQNTRGPSRLITSTALNTVSTHPLFFIKGGRPVELTHNKQGMITPCMQLGLTVESDPPRRRKAAAVSSYKQPTYAPAASFSSVIRWWFLNFWRNSFSQLLSMTTTKDRWWQWRRILAACFSTHNGANWWGSLPQTFCHDGRNCCEQAWVFSVSTHFHNLVSISIRTS